MIYIYLIIYDYTREYLDIINERENCLSPYGRVNRKYFNNLTNDCLTETYCRRSKTYTSPHLYEILVSCF